MGQCAYGIVGHPLRASSQQELDDVRAFCLDGLAHQPAISMMNVVAGIEQLTHVAPVLGEDGALERMIKAILGKVFGVRDVLPALKIRGFSFYRDASVTERADLSFEIIDSFKLKLE